VFSCVKIFRKKVLTTDVLTCYDERRQKIMAFFGMLLLYYEVKKVRTKITLACTECKQRNYETKKERKNHPDRMEFKKHCKFCNKHTLHRETR